MRDTHANTKRRNFSKFPLFLIYYIKIVRDGVEKKYKKKKKKIKKEKTKKRVACCFSFLFYPRAFMKLDIRFVSSLNNRWNYREGRPSAVLKLCQPRCNYYGSCCCTPNYEGSWLRSRIYPKFFRQLIFERAANVLRSVYLEIYFRDDRSRKNKIQPILSNER